MLTPCSALCRSACLLCLPWVRIFFYKHRVLMSISLSGGSNFDQNFVKIFDGFFIKASCERIFSLLERLVDEEQRSSLADLIQAALMLVYNKRCVG